MAFAKVQIKFHVQQGTRTHVEFWNTCVEGVDCDDFARQGMERFRQRERFQEVHPKNYAICYMTGTLTDEERAQADGSAQRAQEAAQAERFQREIDATEARRVEQERLRAARGRLKASASGAT